MDHEAAPVSGLPDIATMLVIMHRHGARACKYTRMLASALSDSGRSDEAEAMRLMTATIIRCQDEIALRKREPRGSLPPIV